MWLLVLVDHFILNGSVVTQRDMVLKITARVYFSRDKYNCFELAIFLLYDPQLITLGRNPIDFEYLYHN